MTDRPTASTINDAQLDELYDELDRARRELAARAEGESADAAAGSCAGRAEQAEAERNAARATNRRLNLRAQQLESELTAYRRAIDTWEFTERGTYIPLRSITAMGKAAGVGYDGTRYELHYERVERAEAALIRVEEAVASFDGRGGIAFDHANFDPPTAGEVLDKVRAALDQPDGTRSARWLHIVFTSPDPTTANTSALNLRDHLTAEFDGVSMRITTNAVEAEPILRDPCPRCESSPTRIPRQLMTEHVATAHPEGGPRRWLLQGARDLSIPEQHRPIAPEQPARTTVNNAPTSNDTTTKES